MYSLYACMMLMLFYSCNDHGSYFQAETNLNKRVVNDTIMYRSSDSLSWSWFLQHLPIVDAPVLDYRGYPVSYQQKHTAIINYDVGTSDLQQCADALMRLRAEYLFTRKRYHEIGFHFTDGQYFSWDAYSEGVRPVAHGSRLQFIRSSNSSAFTHTNLRKYLDIVYAYAGTISLEKELKNTNSFEIGTVVIHGGSPGHCFIIIDEMRTASGEKLFKLAEGYTPAQSIYILRNPWASGISPWYLLKQGTIQTASYTFTNYQLKKFE
ncbi:MAG TPA: DUF4846 domain-containing protein [Flavisolibacter sp.]|nr:DUF4846 domain-containing protein [Flavisolibacter sp.]